MKSRDLSSPRTSRVGTLPLAMFLTLALQALKETAVQASDPGPGPASGSPLGAINTIPTSASQANLSLLDTTDASIVKAELEGASCQALHVCMPPVQHLRVCRGRGQEQGRSQH